MALIQASGEALLLKTCSVNGGSCLHAACCFGHIPIVAHLLSLPCCATLVSLRDRAGRTPLELAEAAGQAGAADAMRAASAEAGTGRAD